VPPRHLAVPPVSCQVTFCGFQLAPKGSFVVEVIDALNLRPLLAVRLSGIAWSRDFNFWLAALTVPADARNLLTTEGSNVQSCAALPLGICPFV
jgi:hypothetical protein